MLFGINFISFHSVEATQFVGMIALCIILFTGGMDTKFSEIRPVIGPGIVLATAGVVMTAVIVAGFVTLIAPWVGLAVSFPAALLLAATMSSTDSASVFSILRSKKQGLNENLRPLLELESGSNDPMAYVLTIVLIGVLSGGAEAVSVPMSIVKFVIQMVLGGLMGYAIGPDRCMDNQSDQFEQSFALSGAFARFRFLYLLVYRPDWRERILGCLPGRIGVG